MTVYGVVRQRWKPLGQDSRCEVELVLQANHLEVNNQQSIGVLLLENLHRDIEAFWQSHRHDPLAGTHTHTHSWSTGLGYRGSPNALFLFS